MREVSSPSTTIQKAIHSLKSLEGFAKKVEGTSAHENTSNDQLLKVLKGTNTTEIRMGEVIAVAKVGISVKVYEQKKNNLR